METPGNRLFAGAVIRGERLRRDWSQEGLCRGICTVSYLSKIEQGKAEGSPDVIRLLLERLEVPWYEDQETMEMGEKWVERGYEAVLSCDPEDPGDLAPEFDAQGPRLASSPYGLDVAVLRGFVHPEQPMEDTGLEEYLDRRQLALWRVQQERYQEALDLYPCAYTWLRAGMDRYARGDSYTAAVECLSQAYQRASEQGYVRLMLLAKLYMGNCYCNQLHLEQMEEQYRVARRLAQALGDESILRSIAYNQASGYLECGEYQNAYAYFSTVDDPTVMDLHKLALCCEKLGLIGEALEALDRADRINWNMELGRQMCHLVRYRLEYPDYLRHTEYGTQLMQVFQDCQTQLPIGYAAFHLPWVLEWYTANRQYRNAYELLRNFPIRVDL
ncbi:helix-turn-helix transcriptional regulator [Pseudoflavonifractor capillosus]|uniref:helix-turn-helix domain-containing protein n=1 Tax=Pseudoflavonifractor capillosus TaxID=106588 RepID=UPI0019579C2E|nr:helix-turn-helix transcriptional regulator [Pseudoflavonifractor capillosus]MBM6694260.1 helix-turn-helix transcriptional regulator [Pseudoflavonifractor capillosus]